MRTRDVIFGLTIVLALFGTVKGAEPIALKVLYAGNPRSDRERDFAVFLRQSFRLVDTIDYRDFKEERAKNYDVIIFDWTTVYPRDRDGKLLEQSGQLNWPTPPKLSERYDRPTILVGAPGQRVVRSLRLKIDNLCFCLGDAAHGMAVTHDVFREPFKVDVSLEERPTPPNYFGFTVGKPIGTTIKVWRVQTKDFPEIDPGLVSDPDGFEDSPDAEVISAGLNTKSPSSVALGRQGNFFFWGFSASPADMTPEARKCFVNSVCYIRKFDGQSPIVHKDERAFTRERAAMLAHYWKNILDDENYKRMIPSVIRDDPNRYEKQRELDIYVCREVFPEDVRKRLGTDPEKYISWVSDNIEWLRPGGDNPDISGICVDEDVRSLGLSNRKIELLDVCVAMLERDDRPELALRVLKRYTSENFDDANHWRHWLNDHRGRLFFTETGGYKFLVAPEGVIPPRHSARLSLGGYLPPTTHNPVAAELEFSPANVRAGDHLTLVVRVETAPSWHIVAKGSIGPEVPTQLSVTLPPEVETDGDWIFPEPLPGAYGRRSYAGSFEFRRRLRVRWDAAPGPIATSCKLSYQACNPFSCKTPTEVTLEAKAKVITK